MSLPIQHPSETVKLRHPQFPDDDSRALSVQAFEDGDGLLVAESLWRPSAVERHIIASGGAIRLRVWGGQPPVSVGVAGLYDDAPLGSLECALDAPDARVDGLERLPGGGVRASSGSTTDEARARAREQRENIGQ